MRLKWRLFMILLVTIILSGCINGGSVSNTNKQAINKLLDQYEKAYAAMDAKKIANLLSYPLNLDGEYLENKEQASFMFNFLFALIDIERFSLVDREITIDSSGVEAGIKAIRVQKEKGYVEERFATTMHVRKVGATWKISGSWY